MKLEFLSAVALSVGLALGAGAYAQGRHDDKPHGPPKKAAAKKSESPAQPHGPGGRHDEKPHGPPAKAKAVNDKKK